MKPEGEQVNKRCSADALLSVADKIIFLVERNVWKFFISKIIFDKYGNRDPYLEL